MLRSSVCTSIAVIAALTGPVSAQTVSRHPLRLTGHAAAGAAKRHHAGRRDAGCSGLLALFCLAEVGVGTFKVMNAVLTPIAAAGKAFPK